MYFCARIIYTNVNNPQSELFEYELNVIESRFNLDLKLLEFKSELFENFK